MMKLGSAGASPALFGALAEKLPMVSREARDTAGGAPRAPRLRHFLERFLQPSHKATAWQATSRLRCATARQALGMTRM